MFASLKKLIKDESGATAIEYGLIAALISVAAIGAFGNPILDQIGDRLRRAGGDEMSASAGAIAEQLPQGRLVPPHQVQDHLGAAARRLDRAGIGKILGRQWPVERQVREIMPAEAVR